MIALRHAATRLAVFSIFVFVLFSAASFTLQAVAAARQVHPLMQDAPVVAGVATTLRSQQTLQPSCGDPDPSSGLSTRPGTPAARPCVDGKPASLEGKRFSGLELTGTDSKSIALPAVKAVGRMTPAGEKTPALRQLVVELRWGLPRPRDPPHAR